ncbi:unnamed protein product [Soboliphyme baturini]|uniref:C2 domain-containing protein n=1 Tax=Soboliphyme baturini TaxID=241478 RepID=A0A183IJ33_9BILA|nr:unnamed protein product [Soboliphyme baturini]
MHLQHRGESHGHQTSRTGVHFQAVDAFGLTSWFLRLPKCPASIAQGHLEIGSLGGLVVTVPWKYAAQRTRVLSSAQDKEMYSAKIDRAIDADHRVMPGAYSTSTSTSSCIGVIRFNLSEREDKAASPRQTQLRVEERCTAAAECLVPAISVSMNNLDGRETSSRPPFSLYSSESSEDQAVDESLCLKTKSLAATDIDSIGTSAGTAANLRILPCAHTLPCFRSACFVPVLLCEHASDSFVRESVIRVICSGPEDGQRRLWSIGVGFVLRQILPFTPTLQFRESFEQCVLESDLKRLAIMCQLYCRLGENNQALTLGYSKVRLRDLKLDSARTLLLTIAPCNEEPKETAEGLGKIQFSLVFSPSTQRIMITVLKAKNIRSINSHVPLNVLVRIYLVCGSKVKRKTTSLKMVHNGVAVFNESIFFPVSHLQVENIYLRLSVVESDADLEMSTIGHVTLGARRNSKEFGHWDQMINEPNKPITMWHELKMRVLE